MIVGAMCGRLLASGIRPRRTMFILAISAAALAGSGMIVSWLGIPIIKRVLSTSFALYSTGWAILFLLMFYWIIEVLTFRRWAFVFIVVGMNSIAAYIMFQLFRGWIDNAIMAFVRVPITAMGEFGEILQACLVLAAQWCVLYFFYRHKIFFKI
jgi:predicted acyltransferase